MTKTTRIITYTIEFIVAVVIILIDLKWFLVYAFMALNIGLDLKVDFLRKVLRVFQVGNETKLMAIQQKLKISDEELKRISNKYMDKLTKEQSDSLEKDYQDIFKY